MQSQSSKRCSRCGSDLPLSAFGAHTQLGLQSQCRACLRQSRREWRTTNAEKVKASKRADYLRHRDTALAKAAARRAARPDLAGEQRAWRAANPDAVAKYNATRRDKIAARPPKPPRLRLTQEERRLRERARDAVTNAVVAGKLNRRPCEECGAEPAQGHHHRGYAEEYWLDVRWLCVPCHWAVHPKWILTERK